MTSLHVICGLLNPQPKILATLIVAIVDTWLEYNL